MEPIEAFVLYGLPLTGLVVAGVAMRLNGWFAPPPAVATVLSVRTELPAVTRVVIIDHGPEGEGLAWEKRGLKDVMASLQDDGRTLKVFMSSSSTDKPAPLMTQLVTPRTSLKADTRMHMHVSIEDAAKMGRGRRWSADMTGE
jgi:hypothetical protein